MPVTLVVTSNVVILLTLKALHEVVCKIFLHKFEYWAIKNLVLNFIYYYNQVNDLKLSHRDVRFVIAELYSV